MATKKQKREAALAKREKFLEEVRRDGLAAQERDRQHRIKNKPCDPECMDCMAVDARP